MRILGQSSRTRMLEQSSRIKTRANDDSVADKLGVPGEVVVKSSGHLTPPVISEVQHVPLLLLPPMFPPVHFDLGHSDVTIDILVSYGVSAHPVGVKSRIVGHIILLVNFVNLIINPVNFFSLVLITLIGVTSVVRELGELGRVH